MTLSKEQKEILIELETLWSKYPSQRLSQLLFNYTNMNQITNISNLVTNPFQYEDNDLLKDLKNKKFQKKKKYYDLKELEIIPKEYFNK